MFSHKPVSSTPAAFLWQKWAGTFSAIFHRPFPLPLNEGCLYICSGPVFHQRAASFSTRFSLSGPSRKSCKCYFPLQVPGAAQISEQNNRNRFYFSAFYAILKKETAGRPVPPVFAIWAFLLAFLQFLRSDFASSGFFGAQERSIFPWLPKNSARISMPSA